MDQEDGAPFYGHGIRVWGQPDPLDNAWPGISVLLWAGADYNCFSLPIVSPSLGWLLATR